MHGLEFDVLGCYLVGAVQEGVFPPCVDGEDPHAANEEEQAPPAIVDDESEGLEAPLGALGEFEHGGHHRWAIDHRWMRGRLIVDSRGGSGTRLREEAGIEPTPACADVEARTMTGPGTCLGLSLRQLAVFGEDMGRLQRIIV